MAGGGGAGPFLSGSGTTGRIAEWGGATTLQSSTLIKSGAGVLTLSAGSTYTLTVAATSSIAGTLSGGGTLATGGYTLTVPATGTAVLGTGAAGYDAYWTSANTLSYKNYAAHGDILMGDGITPADPMLTEDQTDWIYADL